MRNSPFSCAFCAKDSSLLPDKAPLSSYLPLDLHSRILNSFRGNTARSVLVSLALFSWSCLPADARKVNSSKSSTNSTTRSVATPAPTMTAQPVVVPSASPASASTPAVPQAQTGSNNSGESFPTSRDKWLWPLAQNSIWNMPIGSEAIYSPANMQKASYAAADQEYFYKTKSTDPLRKVYAPGSWTNRCSGAAPSYSPDLHVPDNLIVQDATLVPYYTPNNAAAFLMPDGQTLVQLEPLARCVSGGPLYGYHYYEDLSIIGPGIGGSHFGSGLSAIGGSIRQGELTNSEPIRHALKVIIWGEKYLHYSNSSSTPGYRWPAIMADANAANQYHGANPKLVQGTLLAIPPNQTAASLGLQTPAAKKLFRALQDYGAYVVDDSGWDAHYFALEQGVLGEFRNTYGYEFGGNQGAFYEEFMKLFQALQIVDNNGPNSIGGGGTPRQPLAPPFMN